MDFSISREMARPLPPIASDAGRPRFELAAADRVKQAQGDEPAERDETAVGINGAERDEPLREAFQDFVGQTLFGSMLASMRKTVGKPAYLHGGRTEEVFQKQLDQYIVEDLTESSAKTIADPMFELFSLQRRA